MRCPFCRAEDDRVVDSRAVSDGTEIRRRRVCQSCGRRFTTYERPEVAPRRVVKKDGVHAAYSRDKLLRGMIIACEKRQISLDQLNAAVDRIEADLFEDGVHEVPTSTIGEKVSAALKDLDQVAYVRFTSVYREFADIREFVQTLKPLLKDEVRLPLEE